MRRSYWEPCFSIIPQARSLGLHVKSSVLIEAIALEFVSDPGLNWFIPTRYRVIGGWFS